MVNFLIVLEIIFAILLILIVLLQPGNKGRMGAAFGGGGGTTVFGGRGANSFLSKLTTISAVIFMCSNLLLSFMSNYKSSAFDRANVQQDIKQQLEEKIAVDPQKTDSK